MLFGCGRSLFKERIAMGLLRVEGGRPCPVGINCVATELISEGSFSEVYQAYNSYRDAQVAIKLYKDSDPQTHVRAKNECDKLKVLTKLKSGFFPVLDGVRSCRLMNKNYPAIFMELCEYDRQRGFALSQLIPTQHSCTKPLL